MNVLSCPNCSARLFPVELAEKRCTSCMQPLPARLSSPKKPLHDSHAQHLRDEEARPSFVTDGYRDTSDDSRPSARRHGEAADWRLARYGVQSVFVAVALFLVAFVLTFIAAFLAFGGGEEAKVLAQVFWYPALALGGLGALAGVGGEVLLCTLPPRSRGRGWAIAATAFQAVSLLPLLGFVLAVVWIINAPPSGRPGHLDGLGEALFMLFTALALLCGTLVFHFAASLCCAVVFSAAARFWDDRGLGTRFLIHFVIAWVVPLVMVPVLQCAAAAPAAPAGGHAPDAARSETLGVELSAFAVGVFAVAMFVWYLGMLYRLLTRIPKAD